MRVSKHLPVLAGLGVLFAAGGIQLGRSAVAEINPLYFTEREPVFHGALTPYRSQDWAQVQAAEYEQVVAPEELGTGCVGCRAFPVEYVPEHDPAVDAAGEYWVPEAYEPEPVQAVLADEQADPDWQRVERYAGYQVAAAEEAPVEQASADSYESSEPTGL
ncbi:MAG TPA: hypothetical protein VF727_09055 [Allosphingosinicella sp.]|jgi:hypothetical protein